MTQYYHLKDIPYFCDETQDSFIFVVTDYWTGNWEGGGEAWSLSERADGAFVNYHNLGHCSCYGPLDNLTEWTDRIGQRLLST